MSRWTTIFASIAIIAFSLPAIAADDDLPRNIELKPGAAASDAADKTAEDTRHDHAPDRHRGKGRAGGRGAKGGSSFRGGTAGSCGPCRSSTPSCEGRNRASAGAGTGSWSGSTTASGGSSRSRSAAASASRAQA